MPTSAKEGTYLSENGPASANSAIGKMQTIKQSVGDIMERPMRPCRNIKNGLAATFRVTVGIHAVSASWIGAPSGSGSS